MVNIKYWISNKNKKKLSLVFEWETCTFFTLSPERFRKKFEKKIIKKGVNIAKKRNIDPKDIIALRNGGGNFEPLFSKIYSYYTGERDMPFVLNRDVFFPLWEVSYKIDFYKNK